MRIEVFSDRPDSLGEGPVWDPVEERLYWIDSYGPALHSADLRGSDRKRWDLPEPVGSFALREKGGALVALRDGFYGLDLDSGEVELLAGVHKDDLTARLNDGKADRQGRFVAGSMDFEERVPVGKLFRVGADLDLAVLDEGIICSNGPCFSPDGETLYFADSFKKTIYAYGYDTGTGEVTSRRVFATFDDFQGYPDGATVDAEGYVWSVEVYAGRLVRFDPEGAIDRVVGLPVFSATSLAFGGPELDVLFVTSMARPHGGRRHLEREAGMVFAIHGLGVRGLPEPRFAG